MTRRRRRKRRHASRTGAGSSGRWAEQWASRSRREGLCRGSMWLWWLWLWLWLWSWSWSCMSRIEPQASLEHPQPSPAVNQHLCEWPARLHASLSLALPSPLPCLPFFPSLGDLQAPSPFSSDPPPPHHHPSLHRGPATTAPAGCSTHRSLSPPRE